MTMTILLDRPQILRPEPAPNVVEMRPRVRTAIVLPSNSRFSLAAPNSMETVVRTLAGPLKGQDVRVFCCSGADDHAMPGVETLPKNRKDRLRVLLEKLRAFQPEVVEHHQQVQQAVRISAALPQAAHVLYRHNALKAPRHWLDALRYNARYGRMDGLIFVSAAERARFARDYPALADKAWGVPNPIAAAPWLASPEHREPVIAFAARAMAEKGLVEVCRALPPVLDRHLEWRAVLMLNDWEEHGAWAEPHVAPLARYGDRVTVLRSAPLPEVRERMKTAAIALTPSLWDEPFGLTAVEAHAAGAALISSGRGGLREASGPHALYLDAVTPQTLAAAINRLIEDPAERIAMARAAQSYVVRAHSPESRAGDLLRVRHAIRARHRRSRAAEEKSPTRAPG
ncbi:glycosyltransferase family 4 protein [Brevundimonas sp.]|uniref:glycosyltransferase family 4 protein n=1 Tax=Brevundimonas sp. TaxID=1871086 RepID=UPI003F6E7C69